MLLDRKTKFFLGKPKEHFFLEFGHKFTKRCFLFVFFDFRWFFRSKAIFFPRKKLVFRPKSIFFLWGFLVFHSKTLSLVAKSVHFICCLCAWRSSVANKVPVSSVLGFDSA